MWQLVVFLVAFQLQVEAGFFDLTDVDDPLALLWNLPFHQKFSQCRIDSYRNGKCMEKSKCLLTGGIPTGNCGIIFTCCYYENCVKTSDKKQGYFTSANLSDASGSCKYTIKLRNKNVCQVRLDFEELILAPPILTKSSTQSNSVAIYSCANDSLSINPNTYGVPVLCGNSSSQHLYVHVNQTTDPNSAVNIDINLATRLNDVNKYLPKPTWQIKFTQLECPLKKPGLDLTKYGEVENINRDFGLLAPQGVIQYFTAATGQIRSFAFNESSTVYFKSSYPYVEHYTIGFRRSSGVCGIKFTPVTFKLLATSSTPSICKHYLFIPEYYSDSYQGSNELTDGTSIDARCSESRPFYSLPPGPLYINFKAMDASTDAPETSDIQGFVLNYELQTNCPYNNN